MTTQKDTITKRDSSVKYVRVDSSVTLPEIVNQTLFTGLPSISNGIEVVIQNDSNTTLTVTKHDTVYLFRTIIKKRAGKVVKILSIQSDFKIDTIKRSNINKLFSETKSTAIIKPVWQFNWWWFWLAVVIAAFLLWRMSKAI